MRQILFVAVGQSNWQGHAKAENGGDKARAASLVTGARDPFPGCNNWTQGGSCFPYLVDMCATRGVRLDVLNCAIGGASARHYTGLSGATISSPATPASNGFFSGGEMSGGTTVLVEGDSGFDPFSLLSRTRAFVALRIGSYDGIISYWQNGEGDYATAAEDYTAAHKSIANYLYASGSQRHFIGLSSKQPTAPGAGYDTMWAAIQQAVSDLSAGGKPATLGHSLWAEFGESPPLYPESDGTLVHLTLRGQFLQAVLVNRVLESAGY